MFLLQLPDEVDAEIYPVGLEVDEVQAATITGGVQFPGKIDELCKRSTDLAQTNSVSLGG